MIKAARLSSNVEAYVAIDSARFHEHLISTLRAVYDYDVGKVGKQGNVVLLGKLTVVLRVQMRQIEINGKLEVKLGTLVVIYKKLKQLQSSKLN